MLTEQHEAPSMCPSCRVCQDVWSLSRGIITSIILLSCTHTHTDTLSPACALHLSPFEILITVSCRLDRRMFAEHEPPPVLVVTLQHKPASYIQTHTGKVSASFACASVSVRLYQLSEGLETIEGSFWRSARPLTRTWWDYRSIYFFTVTRHLWWRKSKYDYLIKPQGHFYILFHITLNNGPC